MGIERLRKARDPLYVSEDFGRGQGLPKNPDRNGHRVVKGVSFPSEDRPLLDKLLQILKIEKKDFSVWGREQAIDYVMRKMSEETVEIPKALLQKILDWLAVLNFDSLDDDSQLDLDTLVRYLRLLVVPSK